MQQNDVYSKYPKVGNSLSALKYTHTKKVVVYQKQKENSFKNNTNINKDNFTNMLANFLVQVLLKKITNERNLMVFWRYFVCNDAGCSNPPTGQHIQNKT